MDIVRTEKAHIIVTVTLDMNPRSIIKLALTLMNVAEKCRPGVPTDVLTFRVPINVVAPTVKF